jgi:hypothetical protein
LTIKKTLDILKSSRKHLKPIRKGRQAGKDHNMKNLEVMPREERFSALRIMKDNRAALLEVFQETREATPAATVAALVERIGYPAALETVAETVNTVSEWDGRIFPSVREWAANTEAAASREELSRYGLYQPNALHSCHINQIGEAMRDYEPKSEAPATAEEVTEEAAPVVAEFPKLSASVHAHIMEQDEENRFFIENGFCRSWAEENREHSDEGIKRYSTATRWNAYQAGKITREKAVALAQKRSAAELAKREADQMWKLRSAAAAPVLSFVSISVEWKRSSTWGVNPTATVRTDDGVYTGSASGCGYDKESAAVASALNRSPAVMRVLYALKEKGLADGQSEFCASACTKVDNRDICGYGAGYSVVPAFEGGVGVSCFWSIFQRCGYTTRCAASGKSFDAYTVERKAV